MGIAVGTTCLARGLRVRHFDEVVCSCHSDLDLLVEILDVEREGLVRSLKLRLPQLGDDELHGHLLNFARPRLQLGCQGGLSHSRTLEGGLKSAVVSPVGKRS